MLAEDEDEEPSYQASILPTTAALASSSTTVNVTTQLPITTTTISSTNSTDEPKGRAINFSLAEHNNENILMGNVSSKQTSVEDLSDVSMDDDEMEDENMKIMTPKVTDNSTTPFGMMTKLYFNFSITKCFVFQEILVW